MNAVHYSSASNEWTTPQDLFTLIDTEFHFTLDPCCQHDTAKCVKHFTPTENGLKQSWANETVFMNPPYGREIKKWLRKAFLESQTYGATVVCLIPARTDTSYWHEYVMQASEIRCIRGRVKFGNGAQPAPFPSAIVIFAPRNFSARLTSYSLKPVNAQEILWPKNH